MSNSVFIVHGHDAAAMYELKEFLRTLGLTPIVLAHEDDMGMAIIEKFEHYASRSQFAFVILTPDDKVAGGAGIDPWRSRQNVILELGWFMRAVGRARVVLLYKGGVELPSDLLGVLYCEFRDSILEVSEKIRQRLKAQGVI
jgi:predicted nucleotide-binding protein